MIVYSKPKKEFCADLLSNDIHNIIATEIERTIRRKTGEGEKRAFKNSLDYMGKILYDDKIPDDCGISIEYQIPQMSKRIDFIISGSDGERENIIIVELKQWETCELTDKCDIVKTYLNGRIQNTPHPSYQAYSYAAYLKGFNQTIEDELIGVHPCAYLHNYEPDNIIRNPFYQEYIGVAPIFLKPDAIKLREFIKRFIKIGDKTGIIFRIDKGKIKPSKDLADSIDSLMKGNKEFIMIDDQKVVFEVAKSLALISSEKNKNVLIVKGAPGTGKSVVAINLLVELIKFGKLSQYVTKTSAPREVYFDKLQGGMSKVALKRLFTGSGSFSLDKTPMNSFDALIVDEAHRVTKTGFMKQNEDQIKEIIEASLCSIFFIDEDQRVHIDDYGSIETITKIAEECGARVHEPLELASQFRCNGSDGYLAWIDNVLQIRDTANYDLKDINYDFKIFDTPSDLRDAIFEKNRINNKSRLVAGYCWDWVSDKNPNKFDITFPDYNFSMKWNLKTYGSKWIIDPNSINEIGCIHTCQGLDLKYVGVIIGDDLIVRDGKVLVQPHARSKMDRTIFGYKKLLKENPDHAMPLLKSIIKNTYRTLMTRGMEGCYVYCTDNETNEYLKNNLQ